MKITRERGDNYEQLFEVRDGNNTIIALTTETFQLTINSEQDPADATNQVYTVAGSIIDAPNGQVSFAIDGTQPVGISFFDIQMVDTASQRRTLAKGTWEVVQDITKA